MNNTKMIKYMEEGRSLSLFNLYIGMLKFNCKITLVSKSPISSINLYHIRYENEKNNFNSWSYLEPPNKQPRKTKK